MPHFSEITRPNTEILRHAKIRDNGRTMDNCLPDGRMADPKNNAFAYLLLKASGIKFGNFSRLDKNDTEIQPKTKISVYFQAVINF